MARTYKRDARGRFSSTGGSKKKASKPRKSDKDFQVSGKGGGTSVKAGRAAKAAYKAKDGQRRLTNLSKRDAGSKRYTGGSQASKKAAAKTAAAGTGYSRKRAAKKGLSPAAQARRDAGTKATPRSVAPKRPVKKSSSQTPASSIQKTGKLKRPQAESNIRRTGNKTLGPRNAIKAGPKSPRTKMNKAIDDIAGAIKDMKPAMDKMKKAKAKAEKLKKKWTDGMREEAARMYKKPSVTDKRSRDFRGTLTKQARNQDPATGGKKPRKPRKPRKPKQ